MKAKGSIPIKLQLVSGRILFPSSYRLRTKLRELVQTLHCHLRLYLRIYHGFCVTDSTLFFLISIEPKSATQCYGVAARIRPAVLL